MVAHSILVNWDPNRNNILGQLHWCAAMRNISQPNFMLYQTSLVQQQSARVQSILSRLRFRRHKHYWLFGSYRFFLMQPSIYRNFYRQQLCRNCRVVCLNRFNSSFSLDIITALENIAAHYVCLTLDPSEFVLHSPQLFPGLFHICRCLTVIHHCVMQGMAPCPLFVHEHVPMIYLLLAQTTSIISQSLLDMYSSTQCRLSVKPNSGPEYLVLKNTRGKTNTS